jgi:hypothetical protein
MGSSLIALMAGCSFSLNILTQGLLYSASNRSINSCPHPCDLPFPEDFLRYRTIRDETRGLMMQLGVFPP